MNLPDRFVPATPRTTAALSRRLIGCGCLLAVLAAGSGCRDTKVADYRIPKEHDATMATAEPAAAPTPTPGAMPAGEPASPHGSMGTEPLATATGAALTWTAPAGWQPKDLGPMRKGSFNVGGPGGATADLSITAFPGAVGGEFANINRWRGQLSLAPIVESELAGASERVVAGNLTFTVVDVAGAGDQAQRILGAMVPFDGSMWFFKLTGPAAFVAAQKPAFLAFLETVKAPAPVTP